MMQRTGNKPESAPTPVMPTVIGVGSYHGDDQAGWNVVDLLQETNPTAALFFKASVPHDALDWLDRQGIVHIVDACQDAYAAIRRFTIRRCPSGNLGLTSNNPEDPAETTAVFRRLRSNSSHQFDLLSMLELAAVLERFPAQVVLWTIPVAEIASGAGLSERTKQLVIDCVSQLTSELDDA